MLHECVLAPGTRKPRVQRGFREVGGTGLEPVTPSYTVRRSDFGFAGNEFERTEESQ